MTRAQARTRVERLVAKANVGSRFDTSKCNDAIEDANQQVYYEIADTARDRIFTESAISYPASTWGVDLSGASYLNSDFNTIEHVSSTPSSGAITPSNPPTEIPPLANFADVLCSVEIGTSERTEYALLGQKLYLAPMPESATYLKIVWTGPLAALADDAAVLLAARFVRHHWYVCLRAAEILLTEPREQNPNLDRLLAKAERAFKADLISRRQRQRAPEMRDPEGDAWQTK